METDGLNVSMLARAEQLTCAAYFEVAHGNGVAGTKLRVLGNDFKPLLPLDRGI
jgi:hypothetical protein